MDEGFGGVRKVGDEVGNIATWDGFQGSVEKNTAKLGLTGAAGGRPVALGDSLLRQPPEEDPVSLAEVSVCYFGELGDIRGK